MQKSTKVSSRHVSPGALKWHKYHGYGKRISRDALSKNDIVLTTYATVAAAFSRDRSIIHEIEWYRILLDEGMYHHGLHCSFYRI